MNTKRYLQKMKIDDGLNIYILYNYQCYKTHILAIQSKRLDSPYNNQT